MRIMIKGGVWKNTEDEILKAAVMKYGMNQWARVASLLSRKSAKQCKARWYEWLDPSIKKTEWSREEEEKLLHLAKLMPAQWRTIAPIVGRTAAQCMEHYERLLDAAQHQQGDGVDGQGATSDDPRRLRPGEIDPNPENKPARPDPVDMDEDEKEMLSEARARLANTKGKKAKRKAREKQLDEARRMAALQKRRELKAAGLTSRVQHLKKRKFIDYANEIPFQKDVPAGFFDVSDERLLSKRSTLDPKQVALQLDKLEGRRRDDQEEKMRKQDAKRQKTLMKADLPQAIASINEKNDPINAIKRKPLQLPAPVVSNDELTDLAKLGMSAAHAAALALEGSDGTTTRALMGDYSATPLPRGTMTTASQSRDLHDSIMQEAANLAAMSRAATPLLGGENIQLQQGTGYAGATPMRTPARDTPLSSSSASVASSSLRTPLRDELGINPEQLFGMETSARAEKARAKRVKSDLVAGLQSLPAPQNEYEVSVPLKEDGDDADGGRAPLEEDAGDREARLEAYRERQRELELLRRSQAVQHDLPRPARVTAAIVQDPVDAIAQEMLVMIQHDIVKHPSSTTSDAGDKKSKKKSKKNGHEASVVAPQLTQFSDAEMERARNMVAIEANLQQDPWSASFPETAALWMDAQRQLVTSTATGKDTVAVAFAANDSDKIRALQTEFQELKQIEAYLTKRAQKLEDRTRLVTGGFARRADAALTRLRQLGVDVRNAEIEKACFERLAQLETRALQSRMVRLANDVNAQQLVEVQLQKQYAALTQ
jgi:pre-mRNA-splicing factor CDC5/CEF1